MNRAKAQGVTSRALAYVHTTQAPLCRCPACGGTLLPIEFDGEVCKHDEPCKRCGSSLSSVQENSGE